MMCPPGKIMILQCSAAVNGATAISRFVADVIYASSKFYRLLLRRGDESFEYIPGRDYFDRLRATVIVTLNLLQLPQRQCKAR